MVLIHFFFFFLDIDELRCRVNDNANGTILLCKSFLETDGRKKRIDMREENFKCVLVRW